MENRSDEFVTLSSNCILSFVLRQSGVRGTLTEGRVGRNDGNALMVYDRYGKLNEYVSGENLRSWGVICDRILHASGEPVVEVRPVEPKPAAGARVISMPHLGGLQHRYAWRRAA